MSSISLEAKNALAKSWQHSNAFNCHDFRKDFYPYPGSAFKSFRGLLWYGDPKDMVYEKFSFGGREIIFELRGRQAHFFVVQEQPLRRSFIDVAREIVKQRSKKGKRQVI